LKRGSFFGGSGISGVSTVSISAAGSAFVRRHPNRDAVSATTPIETAAPSTTNGTTELRRLRPIPQKFGALDQEAGTGH
jgi:hypothetical protein